MLFPQWMPLLLEMYLWLGMHLYLLKFQSLLRHEQISTYGLHQNIYIHHMKGNMGTKNVDCLITCSFIFWKASKSIKWFWVEENNFSQSHIFLLCIHREQYEMLFSKDSLFANWGCQPQMKKLWISLNSQTHLEHHQCWHVEDISHQFSLLRNDRARTSVSIEYWKHAEYHIRK